ncbi:MAG: adenosine kinase [Alphaproteobacteria bacterium]|nr:adenosine kinase [Alphaproteobacteria bacterium]
MGNAVLDILAEANEEDLTKNNLKKGTMALVEQEDSDKLLNEINFIKKDSGGSVANTLAAISLFGGNSCFCGKVKNDDLGKVFVQSMEKVGTKFLCQMANNGLPTARCIVMVTSDGERTMQTFLGASTTLEKDDLINSFFDNTDYVLIEGYLWSSPSAREAIKKAVDISKDKKIKIVFSLSDPGLVNMFKNEFEEFITNNVDILIGNESEFNELSKNNDEVLKKITDSVDIAAITLGKNGAKIIHNNETINIEANKVDKILDSTGAGDMFAAGFLFKILNDYSIKESAEFGCLAASRIVTQYGARPTDDFLNLIKQSS